ncbi:MAG: SemiSWEET transporter [Candidatus Omnitrophica bacterium]|nr:SemiSWEET transporter [Candidatus Omnitrophota bacterium]
MHTNIIGLIAGTLTTISFLPQVMKILKTRHARDISLGMYVVLAIGMIVWLIYGVMIKELPIMVANGIALVFCLFIIAMKLKYRKRG